MVVDDEKDILHLLKNKLEKYGHDVHAFSNPIEALHEFELSYKNRQPRYNLAVLDIRMPAMSGIELARLIERIDPEIKIILMTAFETTDLEASSGIPIVRYDELMKKPFPPEELCKVVKRHLP